MTDQDDRREPSENDLASTGANEAKPSAEGSAPSAAPAAASEDAPQAADAPASDQPRVETVAADADRGAADDEGAGHPGVEDHGAEDHDAADGAADDDGGDASASDEGGSEDGGDGGAKKKRRRRRRKKKKPGEAEGAEGVASEAQDVRHGAPPRKREGAQLPFQKLFEGTARRHAFSVGEVVAGRIVGVADDVAVIDLFGKATAYARACEPRDVPIDGGTDDADEDESAEPVSDEAMHAAAVEAVALGETEAEAALEAEEASSPEASETAPSETAPSEAASEPASSDVAPTETVSEAASTDAAPTETAESEAAPTEAVAEASPEVGAEDESRPARARREAPPPPEPATEPEYAVQPEGVEPVPSAGVFRGRVGAVAESGHIGIVNQRIDRKATRRWLAQCRNDRTRVPGLIFGFNRGGFDVLVYGMRAFCPVSAITIENIDDPLPLLGRWAEFHVQTARSGNQGLVVSRRSILEKEARKAARAMLKSLAPGQTVKGVVTHVRDYGIFVDIGGVEGLAHQSELSWEHGARPADLYKPGDEIEVQVLKVHERENKRERHDRVSLSRKALLPDPWDAHSEVLTEGNTIEGTVVRTAEFGAFIAIAPGIDGLLHVSELGGRDLKHANQAVSEGDTVHVVIERVDPKTRRISLSRLSAEEVELVKKGELDPSHRPAKLKVGSNIKVVVTQVVSAGLQVRIDNVVGKRGRGFIPNVEMGTPRGTDHRKQWPPGKEIDVTIIGVDRDGGLRCSRKKYLQDEERRAVRDYKKEVSKQGLGTFGDILRQKLGIE